jgi:hypothetical protein
MGRLKVLGSPLHLGGTPVTYRRRPPLLGEHTGEVLEEASGHRHGLASVPDAGVAAAEAQSWRPPRWAVERVLAVEHRGTSSRTTTLNVSRDGCALRWVGPLPDVWDEITIGMGPEPSAAKMSAVVRWCPPHGAADRAVGLRLIGDDSPDLAAWHDLVADVVQSGACAA